MGNCDNLNDCCLLPINYGKGKSSHHVTPRSGNIWPRKIRKPSNLFDGSVEFINEAFRSSRILSGIPIVSGLCFRQSLFVKADRFGRHLPREDTAPRL